MSTGSVLHRVVAHAGARPGRPAVKDPDRDLSYGELVDAVRKVAGGLSERGVRAGDTVALHLPNCCDFVVTALACSWVGAAFVPLAMTDPEARLLSILRDCGPALVVTSAGPARGGPSDRPTDQRGRPSAADLSEFEPVPFADLEGSSPAPASPTTADPAAAAYSIYTSGTTGSPKGVLIPNGAFAAAVDSTAQALGLGSSTRTLCVSPFHFDGAFGTLFPTLAYGGAVVIRPREALLYPRTFFNAVAQEEITYTGFSPSYLRLLLSSPQVRRLADTALDVIALGGEASAVADVRALWTAAPKVRVFNRYGPTETTIAVTHVELTHELTLNGTIPIGRPHAGVTFHLIGDNGEEIHEPERVGELYIGGVQLMLGYWNAPELTAQVLRSDVVASRTVYRTGDLVYLDHTGNYVYVDRADRVMKRSGVRISLVELTEAMRDVSGVASATCVAFDDDGQPGIVAFVVPSGPVSTLELHREARKRLPETMIPNRIELVDSLPLTMSSKLDERRLLESAGLRALQPVGVPGSPSRAG